MGSVQISPSHRRLDGATAWYILILIASLKVTVLVVHHTRAGVTRQLAHFADACRLYRSVEGTVRRDMDCRSRNIRNGRRVDLRLSAFYADNGRGWCGSWNGFSEGPVSYRDCL